ncbi:hypothetical protein HDU86_004580 [Geranomyces michiganensis]|nr:hypothetical protein HDU86_004580 [Geranomyces michiganensis]
MRSCFSSIAELEKKLRYLIKHPASKGVFSEDVQQARVQLRDALERRILQASESAPGSGKEEDLEANLWKLAHYKVIEEFRKAEKSVHNSAKRAGQAADRDELRLLTAHFRRFLSEATAFYARFICRLHRTFDLRGNAMATIIRQLRFAVGSDAEDENFVASTFVSEAATRRALKACHRSLIYLGDLARYRERHADRKAADWSAAVMFYNMAIRLIPDNGNPYNQLAVIASHLDDELRAMECYTRSLAAVRPFGTASENLQILFEKVNKRCAGSFPELSSVDSATLKENFILLVSKAIGKNQNLSEFAAVSNEWLAAFAHLLERRALDGNSALKIFVIGVAICHLIQKSPTGDALDKLGGVSEWGAPIHAFLVSMVRTVFATVAEDYTSGIEESSQRDHHGLLPTVMVMMIWLTMEARERPAEFMNETSLCEEVARALNAFALIAGPDLPRSVDNRTTSEEADLAGFMPMHSYFALLDCDYNGGLTAAVVDRTGGEHDHHRIRRIVTCGIMIADAMAGQVGSRRAKQLLKQEFSLVFQGLTLVQDRKRRLVFKAAKMNHRASPPAVKPISDTPSLSADSQSYVTPSYSTNTSEDFNDNENVAPGLKRSASGQPKVQWSAPTVTVPTASSAAMTPALPFPSGGGVDEDSFGRRIVLPSAGFGDFPFSQRKASAPIPVPRKLDGTFRSDSPDVTNMFGTSSDAVNTMSFLGLGSPDVRGLARSRDPRAINVQAPSGQRVSQYAGAPPSPAKFGDTINPPGLSVLAVPLPPDPLSTPAFASAPLSKVPDPWSAESAYPFTSPTTVARRPSDPTWTGNDALASGTVTWTSFTPMVTNNIDSTLGQAGAQPPHWLSPGYVSTAHSLASPNEKDQPTTYSTTPHPSLWG